MSILEELAVKKEIMVKTSRLYYITHKEEIKAKQKARPKVKREWKDRADNPKNKNKVTFKKYYSKAKFNLFKSWVLWGEYSK